MKDSSIRKCELGPKNSKSLKLVEKGVDLGSAIKDSLLPNEVLQGGTLLLFHVVYVDNIIKKFYMGHLPMKIKFNVNIGCVMSLKWSHVR